MLVSGCGHAPGRYLYISLEDRISDISELSSEWLAISL